ncbi:MAG: SDR family NAD(P)-dependent oxidoreductase [Nitratireductor sp.]|nr:SDR family NAD(P)-dependent oxidoreductase [Nitratireductor sp.]
MAGSLSQKHIVVTGGAGALGTAVVARLVEEGATCHVPVQENEAPGGDIKIHYVTNVDLSDANAVGQFYSQIGDLWASVHLAGGFAFGKTVGAEDDALTDMFQVNVLTAWLCCRAAASRMIEAGNGGRIVNVAARPALEPRTGSGMVAYTASKAAVAAMTAALGEELKGDNILVNAIAPSILDTPANRNDMPKANSAKWVSLEAAAELIAFLVSPRNAATSSAVIPLYAGA